MSNTDWYGVVPSTWSISRLKNILIERNERNNPIKTDFILSLTNDRGVIPYSEKGAVGNNSKEDITGYKLAYPGDLVLNSMNVVIGSVSISNYFGCVSPVYYMLRPRSEYDSIEFFNYLFQTTELQSALKGYGNGILEIRMRIAMSKLNTFLLPKPDYRVQTKIVQKIKESEVKIDQLINNQKKQIEKLKEYKQSLISEVVTKGLDQNVEFKDSGVEWIGKIPTQWSVYKIKSLFATIGSGTTPNSADEYLYKDEVNWIQSGDLGTKYLKTVSKKVSEDALNSISTLRIYKSPFVVIAMYGASIGSLSISKIDSCTNQACCVLAEPKNIINIEYVYYFIQSTKEALVLHGKGGTQPNISQDTIKRFFITLPPLSEQNMIVDYLKTKVNKVDALITVKHSKIDKLNDYKKSLIYEYVTGKKEVS